MNTTTPTDKIFVFRVEDANGAIWKMPCTSQSIKTNAHGQLDDCQPAYTGNDASATADPDNDGLSNYTEYALNLNPTTTSGAIEITEDVQQLTVHIRETVRPPCTSYSAGKFRFTTTNWVTIGTTSATNPRPNTEWRNRIDTLTNPSYYLRIKVQ